MPSCLHWKAHRLPLLLLLLLLLLLEEEEEEEEEAMVQRSTPRGGNNERAVLLDGLRQADERGKTCTRKDNKHPGTEVVDDHAGDTNDQRADSPDEPQAWLADEYGRGLSVSIFVCEYAYFLFSSPWGTSPFRRHRLCLTNRCRRP